MLNLGRLQLAFQTAYSSLYQRCITLLQYKVVEGVFKEVGEAVNEGQHGESLVEFDLCQEAL